MKRRLPTLIAAFPIFLACGPNGNGGDASTGWPEECNNRDDDGDGVVDEDESGGPLRRDCSNACGTGFEECEAGEWRYCSAPTPIEESCNGADDDCDGTVDEDCACRHGERRSCGIDVGVCEPGVEHCDFGTWGQCQLPYDPDALVEVCNDGLDNDCDGDTDEDCACVPGTSQPCGVDEGECRPGEMLCLEDSTWSNECSGEIGPEDDVCDGLDNNCDGRIDFVTAADFGWVSDAQEPNDGCDEASPLFNASGLARLEQDGEWVSVRVSDGTDLMTYPSLYAAGDEDWYSTRAVETSNACIPWTSECTYIVRVQLQLLDRDLVVWAAQEYQDYRVCVVLGDCSATTEPANMVCSHESDWSEASSSYFLNVMWGGSCGADDSRDVKIRVHSPSGAACGYYQLSARFYYDNTIACP